MRKMRNLVKPEEISFDTFSLIDPNREIERVYLSLAIGRKLVSERGKWILIQYTGFQSVEMMFPGEDPSLFFTSTEAVENYFDLFFKNNPHFNSFPYLICRVEKMLNEEKKPVIKHDGAMLIVSSR